MDVCSVAGDDVGEVDVVGGEVVAEATAEHVVGDAGEHPGGHAEPGEPHGDVRRAAAGAGLEILRHRRRYEIDQRLARDGDDALTASRCTDDPLPSSGRAPRARRAYRVGPRCRDARAAHPHDRAAPHLADGWRAAPRGLDRRCEAWTDAAWCEAGLRYAGGAGGGAAHVVRSAGWPRAACPAGAGSGGARGRLGVAGSGPAPLTRAKIGQPVATAFLPAGVTANHTLPDALASGVARRLVAAVAVDRPAADRELQLAVGALDGVDGGPHPRRRASPPSPPPRTRRAPAATAWRRSRCSWTSRAWACPCRSGRACSRCRRRRRCRARRSGSRSAPGPRAAAGAGGAAGAATGAGEGTPAIVLLVPHAPSETAAAAASATRGAHECGSWRSSGMRPGDLPGVAAFTAAGVAPVHRPLPRMRRSRHGSPAAPAARPGGDAPRSHGLPLGAGRAAPRLRHPGCAVR